MDEDARPSVDVHHGHGVLIGDGGTQTNYFYVATAGTADAAPADQAAAAPPPSRGAEADFTRLGVHPALGFADVRRDEDSGRDWYPPYVPRDRDGQIDQALAGGGLVIVEGRSGAGKSRAAAEAVRRVAADWRLLIPADRRELAALSQPPGLACAMPLCGWTILSASAGRADLTCRCSNGCVPGDVRTW